MLGMTLGFRWEVAMAAHFLHHADPHHFSWLDLMLVLAGAMIAWLFWPITSIHH